jgi:outer membrane immunogenic protein
LFARPHYPLGSEGMRVMQRILLGAAAAVAIAGSAAAADLPYKGPPELPYPAAPEPYKAPPRVWLWSGLYLGVNVGGAWAHGNFTTADPFNTFNLTGGPFVPVSRDGNGSGVAGGLHGGFNWQVSRTFLLGVEGDISGTGMKINGFSAPLISTNTASASFASSQLSVRSLASIRVRAGYVVHDSLLFYGTAGWGGAGTRFTADAECPPVGVGTNGCNGANGVHAPVSSLSKARTGAVFGVGTEYMWGHSEWILGIEYLRYQLNGFSTLGMTQTLFGVPFSAAAACPAGTPCVAYTSSSFGITEVRARLSYKFGYGLAGIATGY